MDLGSLSSLLDLFITDSFFQRDLLVFPVFLWLISPDLLANFGKLVDDRPQSSAQKQHFFSIHFFIMKLTKKV